MQNVGCLLLHGFAGNPGEVWPLAEQLRDTGFDVLSPVLAGHNLRRRDLSLSTARQWVESAVEAYFTLESRCDAVMVVGFSMGGLLAVHLAVEKKPAAAVLVNMPVYYWDFERIFLNLRQDVISRSPKYLKLYVKTCVDKPMSSLWHFQNLLRDTIPLLPRLACPLFVAQGLWDDTVRAKSAPYIYNHAKSAYKQLRFYDRGTHDIFHSDAAQPLIRDIRAFLQSQGGG